MKNRFFLLLSISAFLSTCVSYDNAVIYHKNFDPGKNALLRFDGYYTEDPPVMNEFNVSSVSVKPVFFYSNGSVFATNHFDWETGMNVSKLDGSWGNYLLHGDSITLEKFQRFQNNYDRIILKGIMAKDEIHWYSRQLRKHDPEKVDYSIRFRPWDKKPDSTQNFTRVWPKYNH